MYIIIPAYEPDKRLIQVVQDITIKLPKALNCTPKVRQKKSNF